MTSCEEIPHLPSFPSQYLPPPKIPFLTSTSSEVVLLLGLNHGLSGQLLKSHYPDSSLLTTDKVKWRKGGQKIKGTQRQKDKLTANLFNTGCASQGRGAGNRSQYPEITLTAQHRSWLRARPCLCLAPGLWHQFISPFKAPDSWYNHQCRVCSVNHN